MKEFTVTFEKSNFSRENAIMKSKRINLKLNTILLWLGRHVVYDHYLNSEWFGGKEDGTDYVFWFKLEKDRDRAEIFINEIIENGIPRIRN